jgi:hypothetical protein
VLTVVDFGEQSGGPGLPQGLNNLLGPGETLLHSGLVMLGYGVLFAALLVWLFLRTDVD